MAAEQALLPPIAELAPNVVVKQGYSAAPSLPVAELKALTEVRVVGADTDACVLATALGLFDLGVPVVVMADLTYSAGGASITSQGFPFSGGNSALGACDESAGIACIALRHV